MSGDISQGRRTLSDECLMELVGREDRDAFGVLVERHRARLEAFVYRLLGQSEAVEDCVQEVLVRLWLARGRYEPRTKLTTYLYTIALNHCIDCSRRARARPRTVPLEQQVGSEARAVLQAMVARGGQPDAVLHHKHQMYRVRTAVSNLPLPQRSAFVLAHFEQLPYEEISQILDVPVGTVKSRVFYALRRLRETLGPE